MASDQTFRKIKKRARKDGLTQPQTISKKGNRWFLIDKMDANTAPSRLTTKLVQRGIYGDRTGFRRFIKDVLRWLFY